LLRTLSGAKFLTSVTTRKPRDEDFPGEYEHISKSEFEAAVARGEFFVYTKFSRNYYGMREATIQAALKRKSLSVRPITPGNIPRWWERLGNRGAFLHIAPPPETEIRRRLTERGSSAREIARRIREARNWERQIAGFIRVGMPIRIVTGRNRSAKLDNALRIIEAAP
jgi:guanylate kinase